MSDYVPSASASSSRASNYQVFLSFRGKDTRRTFVSHLYDALQQKGIHTFKDDVKLKTGKTISNELLKAIQESRSAIVIFSKEYASSRWCLEELAHIIKCKHELDLEVIPVFYDVNPTDVRHQKSPFDESFSKHEKRCKDDMEKVQRWRDAFAEAGKLAGYHLQNIKDEADCIKKLIADIFPKLVKVISPFPDNFVGTQIEKVMSLLNLDSNQDVRSIGIWGMGGIGKTEIARCLHQRYRDSFDADCFLGDVGALYQSNGLTWLAQALIRKLLGEKMTLTSEHEGVVIIKNMLRHKKVLLILDNVSHQEQLECLAGDPEWFGNGSRIIVTARDKQLLISHVGDNLYEVQLLTAEEALELFSRYAFKEKSPKEDFIELSRQVVQYAGRLPLALKVLGSYFYGRDKEQYRGIIDRLMKIPHNDILAKLRISFDGLEKDVKEMFLDMACLYEDNTTEYVELVLQSRGIKWIVLDFLVDKSLLSINRDNYGFEMHNLIREMGESISREEYTNNRIWLNEEVHDLFVGNLETEKVESLWIQKSYEFEDDFVKISKVFKRMKRLQVLRIEYANFSSNCTITHLPSSLRFVDWSGYPSSSLPENFKPSQLVVLWLHNSWLVELCAIPKKLSNLKHLDLSWSFQLTKTPNFGDIPNLETLYLRSCENLEEVHPSLGHCRMLKVLDLSGCTKLQKLPKFVSMLKVLDLSYSLQLTKTPNFGDIPNLETLKLRGCENFEEVHPSLGHCRMLKELDLFECRKLKKLPKFVSMECLETLDLRRCTSLKKFPKISRPMQSLSELFVGSPWIRSLPSYLGNLTRLELYDCEVLESIPDSFVQNLKRLYISGCNKLAMLPPSLGVQSELVSIHIADCENLKKLPNSIQKETLRHLEISGCPKLDTFPEINGDMQRLSYLALQSTVINGELLSSIGNLSCLSYLDLSGCEDLVSLPNSICNLKNLQRLFLNYCKKLEKLPENIGDLQQLRELFAKETSISRLPPSIVKLTKLGFLCLSNCNILGRLPQEIGSLHSLQSLDVSGSNISCLPKSISKLFNLTSLNVQYCTSLSELPGKLPPDLNDLNVSGSNISCLPKSISKLLNLTSLNVQYCTSLSELPRQLPPNLVRLYADDHLALKSIRDLLIKCVKLEEISFSESNNVQQIAASTNQNLLKFLSYILRTFIQCHFHQRHPFHICFPLGRRIPKSFGCEFSINLKPSWYTDNFKGFFICFCVNNHLGELTCQLSDPGRKHTLRYSIYSYMVPHALFLSISYIPYKSFWLASHCEERKSPNDYCLFEVSTSGYAKCWRVYLVYENKGESGLSSTFFVPVEPSYASNHLQVYDEQNTATDMVLHLGYEIEAELEVDHKEHETQNVELIRVCDGPSRKIGDASRKRKRKRSNKRKKIIEETSA